MKRALLPCLAALFIFAGTVPGFCAEGEKVYAVQNKIFHTFHEIGIDAGYTPSDDFFDVFPTGLHYSYSFSDKFSWEVVRYQQAFNRSKGLKKELEKEFEITVKKFTEPRYYVHSHLVFKPLYGKSAFLNRKIINQETSFLLGLGIENFETRFVKEERVTTENAPSLSLGVATKYFINRSFAFNIEVRDIVNFRNSNTVNSVYMGLGITYRFNLSPRSAETEPEAERVRRYLKRDGS